MNKSIATRIIYICLIYIVTKYNGNNALFYKQIVADLSQWIVGVKGNGGKGGGQGR